MNGIWRNCGREKDFNLRDADSVLEVEGFVAFYILLPTCYQFWYLSGISDDMERHAPITSMIAGKDTARAQGVGEVALFFDLRDSSVAVVGRVAKDDKDGAVLLDLF